MPDLRRSATGHSVRCIRAEVVRAQAGLVASATPTSWPRRMRASLCSPCVSVCASYGDADASSTT